MPPLLDLISRINTSFGRFYASMHCAGEVCLYTGEEDQVGFISFLLHVISIRFTPIKTFLVVF